MSVVALYHVKGGVGKTASAVNLAYLAAEEHKPTLLIDLDSQSSASYYLRVKPRIKAGLKGFLRGGKKLEQSIKGTDYPDLDILPADFELRNLDIAFNKLKHATDRLSMILEPVKKEYAYIFLDCPPNLTMVSENIFNSVDIILVPVVPTTLSLRTFDQLLSFFRKHNYRRKKIVPFFSMVERRKKLHRETMNTVRTTYKRVLATEIPYATDVERMGICREPVAAYAPRSRAAQAYRKLWREVGEIVKE